MTSRSRILIPLVFTLLVGSSEHSSAQLMAPCKLIRGKLQNDRTGAPVDGGRVWVYQGTVKEPVTNSRINPADGSFQVLLDASTEYRFYVVAPSYFRYDIIYVTPPEIEYEEVDTMLRVPPIPVGESLFNGRLFDPGSSQLAGTDRLVKTVELLRLHPNVTVRIVIVPDVTGTPKTQAKASKKPKKKPKKGAVVVEPPPPPPVPPVDFTALGAARQNELKNFFKKERVSVTRLAWEIAPGIEHAYGTTDPLPANVNVTISGIEPLEEEDDD